MSKTKERMISDVLSEMSKSELEAIYIICNYAAGIKGYSIPVAVRAAELIRDKLISEKQKVAYYLIGQAEADQKIPIILSIFYETRKEKHHADR